MKLNGEVGWEKLSLFELFALAIKKSSAAICWSCWARTSEDRLLERDPDRPSRFGGVSLEALSDWRRIGLATLVFLRSRVALMAKAPCLLLPFELGFEALCSFELEFWRSKMATPRTPSP